MNFLYMPELEWRWAYPLVWVIFLSIAATMLTYFRRRGWL
jgi:magnesium transporter